MNKFYFLFLTLSYVSFLSAQQISFEQMPAAPPGSQIIANILGITNGTVTFCDLDSDGDSDLFVTGYSTHRRIAKLYMNIENRAFEEDIDAPFEGVDNSSVGFEDVDGDGDFDLFVIGNTAEGSIAKLYKNNGAGAFPEVIEKPFKPMANGFVAFADVDGDYDQDLLVTGRSRSGNESILYLNEGNGKYTIALNTSFATGDCKGVSFIDVENDGDSDLFIVNNNQTLLYLNDGRGLFSEVLDTPFKENTTFAFAIADVDRDGDPDYVMASSEGYGKSFTKCYLNDGNGMYSDGLDFVETTMDVQKMGFADIDGDKDLDLLLTGKGDCMGDDVPLTKLYENNGLGSFAFHPKNSLKDVFDGNFDFADVDQDNDIDLLLSGRTKEGVISWLYQNDGEGSFSHGAVSAFKGVYKGSVALADFEGDGDLDIAISGAKKKLGGYSMEFYANDGLGAYSESAVNNDFNGLVNSAIAFADVDSDGDMDLFATGENFANPTSSALYFNNGNGKFEYPHYNSFQGVNRGAAVFKDVDRDGDVDLLVAGSSFRGNVVILYKNDGRGYFSEVVGTPFIGVYDCAAAFSDIDKDGDYDLIVTGVTDSYEPSTMVYKNDGSGNFSIMADTPFVNVRSGSLALADIDSDHDDDLLITGKADSGGLVAELYFNDGSGHFAKATGTSFVKVQNSSAEFADLDRDGDSDLIIAGNIATSMDYPKSTLKIYENDGTGRFQEVNGLAVDGVCHSSIALADVDGDQFKDLLVTGYNDDFRYISRLYRNTSSACNPVYYKDDITACDSYTWIDGVTYNSSNSSAIHTVKNGSGCDLIIRLNLSIKTTDVSVTTNGNVITANSRYSVYRWLDCSNNYAVIEGARGRHFTAPSNGLYAVEVTKNGCTNTSDCIPILSTAVSDATFSEQIRLFPNPTTGLVNVKTGDLANPSIRVYTIQGTLVYEATKNSGDGFIIHLNQAPGLYFIEILAEGKKKTLKLMKE